VKRQGLFLIVIYLVTRLVCWQLRPVYYDAFEYVRVVDQAKEMGVVDWGRLRDGQVRWFWRF